MDAPLLLPIATSTNTTTTATSFSPSSTKNIVVRVVTILAVASASLFAHHEASRGFDIAVVNAAPRHSVAGRRFDVFFVSNGRAARALHDANRAVEQVLFPDTSFPRKLVTRVTVQMAGHNLTDEATVAAGAAPGEYVISLSPSLMSSADTSAAVAAAVRRAVARMWLWDGRGAAPPRLLESMLTYLADDTEAEASPEDGNAQCMSARFLKHLEGQSGGFVARLNQAMRDRWSDNAVDAALGVPARPVCAAYRQALTGQAERTVGSTSDGDGSTLAM